MVAQAKIHLSVDGSSQVISEFDRVENKVGKLGDVMDRFKSQLAVLGVGLGVTEIARLSDEYTKFTAQLKLATNGQTEYVNAHAKVRDIAKASQSDLASTGVLYARIANGTRELGISQQKVGEIVEAVTLSLKASGATQEESSSAMQQLSQAFASGTLRGQEFNAVNDAAPRVMKALADGLGVPVGALREMAEAGKITSQVMADNLPQALEGLRKEAAQVQTIGGAYTHLKNNVMEMVGAQAQQNGSAALLAGTINVLADNLNLVTSAAAGLTATRIGAKLIEMGLSAKASAAASTELTAAKARESAAAIAAAQANVTESSTKLAQLTETRAGIIAAREDTVAKLAVANAAITQAQAQIQASTSAGALSAALAATRQGEINLTAAMQARAVATSELAILGRQQASVAAQATTATAAATAAQVGLSTAVASASVGTGLLARAVGFLGGPIGIITTALGLGVTAWMAWGNKAKESNEKAVSSTQEAADAVVKSLNEQIARYETIIKLRKQGMSLEDAKNVDFNQMKSLEDQKKALVDLDAKRSQYIKKNESDQALSLAKLTDQARIARGVETKEVAAFYQAKINSDKEYLAARARIATSISDIESKSVKSKTTGEEANAITRDEKLKAWFDQNGTAAQRMTAELDKLKKEFGEIPPEMDKLIRKKYEEKNSTAAQVSSYNKLIESIQGKIKTTKIEIATIGMVLESEKIRAAMEVDRESKQPEYTEAQRLKIELIADELKVQEKKLAQAKLSHEFDQQALEDNVRFADTMSDSTLKLQDQVVAQIAYNDKIGLSKTALADLEIAQIYEDAAKKEALATTMDSIDWSGKLGDEYRKQAVALRDLAKAKKEGALKEADFELAHTQLKAIEEESKRFYDDLYRGLSDSLYRGFESGKGFGKSFMDGIKNLFKTTVLKIAVQGVMTGVLGMGTMAAANASPMAGDGVGGLGGISNMVTAGKSLWEGFTAAGTLGNGFWGSLAGGLNGAGAGSGLTSSLGLNMGNYLQGALGNNLAGSLSSGISSISAAMPYAAAAIAAFQISKSINGGYRLGGLSADAGALLGFAPRLFGMQDKQMGGQTVTGALGTQDLMRNQAWSQKGGLFRSDRAGTWSYGLKDSTAIQDGKSYVDSASLSNDKALLNGLNAGYAAIKTASSEFAKALGLNAESIAQRTDQLNLTLGKTQEETNAAIQKTFAVIADSIALQLLPGVRELSREDENAAATLARVANQFVVINHTFDDLGLKLFEMSDAGIKASDKFALAIGGLDALKSVTATYYENFFTQEERSAALVKSLSAEFEKQNLVLPNSREGYRALVEEVSKLGTPEQLASLLKLNEAFASVVPATERLVAGAALVSSSADKAASILQERQSLQDRLDQLTMTSSQLLRKQRDALDESNRALFDQVQAAMSTKAAQEAQTLAAQTNADALASINASYQQQIDALIKASLPLAEQRALESRGMDDSTLALFNRRNALEDEAAASKEATTAAQQLTSTLKASASDSLAALGKSVATEKLGAKSSLDAKIAIINAQKSAAAASFQWSKMAGEASIKTATEANQKISALAGSLKSTLDGMRLSATQASDRIAAQAQISQALTLAKSTGILPDVNFLSDALKTVSQPNESLFSSYTEFARDFYVTAGQIADLNTITGDALSKSDVMLEMAKAQLLSTEQAAAASAAGFDEQIKKAQEEYDLQISQFDQVMTNAQAQLEAALGTNVAILSMADALRGFQSSLGAMMSSRTTHPAAGSVAGTSSQKTSGASSLDSFKASLRSQPNYSAAIDAGGGYQFAYDAWANGSHANGLDSVPFDGYRAQLHQGEMVLPAHVAQSVRGGGNSDLTRELLDELRKVKEQMILLTREAVKTSDNTKKSADVLDSVTEGGSAMRSEVV